MERPTLELPKKSEAAQAVLAAASEALASGDAATALKCAKKLGTEFIDQDAFLRTCADHMIGEAIMVAAIHNLSVPGGNYDAGYYLSRALEQSASLHGAHESVGHLLRGSIFCSLATNAHFAQTGHSKHYLTWAAQHLAHATHLIQARWLELWLDDRQRLGFATQSPLQLLVAPITYPTTPGGHLVPPMLVAELYPDMSAEATESHSPDE